MNPSLVLLLLLGTMTTGLILVVRLRSRPVPTPASFDGDPVPVTQPVTRAGAMAGTTPDPPARPLSDQPSGSLADMLEGIRLPYDLMPVTTEVEDADRHLIFLTTHSNAEEVGQRFADELERLGFELETVDFDQAVASRGDDVVSMKIVPDAARIEGAESLRYGPAGPGDVALEAWIGRSSVPPSRPD